MGRTIVLTGSISFMGSIKGSMDNEKYKTQWHSAFYAATRIELIENQEDLEYIEEYLLSKKSQQVDLLIIKKNSEVSIKNEIGRLFGKYNIIEYKSANDSLGIDTFFKVYGYACQFKADGKHEDEIKLEDVTITFIRRRKPIKLFKWFEKYEFGIEEKYPGIYYIGKKGNFIIQIIVTDKVDRDSHLWLTSLRDNLEKDTAVDLLESASAAEDRGYKQLTDAIFQVIVKENKELFFRIKEEGYMCEALRELMAPEIEAEVKIKVEETLKVRLKEYEEEVKQQVKQQVTQQVTQKVTQQVTQKVTQQVSEDCIKNIILDYLEEKRDKEYIVSKIMKLFEKNKKEAEKYYRRFAHE